MPTQVSSRAVISLPFKADQSLRRPQIALIVEEMPICWPLRTLQQAEAQGQKTLFTIVIWPQSPRSNHSETTPQTLCSTQLTLSKIEHRLSISAMVLLPTLTAQPMVTAFCYTSATTKKVLADWLTL